MVSSISPWRQFLPSTVDIEAISVDTVSQWDRQEAVETVGNNVLPAPNALALVGSSTSSTTRKTIEGEMPLSMRSAMFCDPIDCLQEQSVAEAQSFFCAGSWFLYFW